MKEPEWANVKYEKPDLQKISYYSAPSNKPKYNSLDEVDPELLETFKKLGISVDEQKKLAGVAVDVVIDSVSVAISPSFEPTTEPIDPVNVETAVTADDIK